MPQDIKKILVANRGEIAIRVLRAVIADSHVILDTVEIACAEARRIGYPLMLKAASGGGGRGMRGMRVVRAEAELQSAFSEARSEAAKAFGDDTVFLEKFIEAPKHIEVQVLGDTQGDLVVEFQ